MEEVYGLPVPAQRPKVVVLGWQWLWIVPLIDLWCFFSSEIYYFTVVDILFYYDVYIILLR